LSRLAQTLNERHIPYALIGGLAVVIRSTVRATQDIDVLLHPAQLQLPGLLDALVEAGFTLDPQQAIQTWNRDHLLNFKFGSVRVDWLQPVLPAFERVLARARPEQFAGRSINVADAEGLLLLKVIAFRARDQEDIKGILSANSGKLDLDWVRQEWRQLDGDNDPRTAQFEQFVREFYDAPTQ